MGNQTTTVIRDGYVRRDGSTWTVVVKRGGPPAVFQGYPDEATARTALPERVAEVRQSYWRRTPRLVTCEACGQQRPVSAMTGNRDVGYRCDVDSSCIYA
jgi:hypothetical protein